ALLCTLAAVWLLLAEPHASRPELRSLTRVLIATVALGLANLFLKVGVRAGALPETMVAAQAWVFSSTATLLVLLRDRRLPLASPIWRFSAPAAVTLVVGFVLLLHALTFGSVSVIAPVTQMSFVLTALAGAILFGETLDWRKRIGLLAAAAALALFAGS